MRKPYIVQVANTTINPNEWDNEKAEITLERAINWAEKEIASDAELGLPDAYAYRIIECATDEVVWHT